MKYDWLKFHKNISQKLIKLKIRFRNFRLLLRMGLGKLSKSQQPIDGVGPILIIQSIIIDKKPKIILKRIWISLIII